VSVIGATNGREPRLDLAIRIMERDERIAVASGEGIKGPKGQLAALLRHPPPSICPRRTRGQPPAGPLETAAPPRATRARWSAERSGASTALGLPYAATRPPR